MKISIKLQSVVISSLILCSPLTFAADTIWIAGSTHKGTVTVPIENGPNVVWKCDGTVCRMSGPWGNQLSIDSCQSLVSRIGKITFYKNSAGKIWTKNSKELAECNQAAK
ncbi:hypothetical protein ACNPQK_17380 [Acinetobacter guillouiae]|jgi:hypothetical protein|uniref:hypothetical protein n=1 Tax=Acinetobacter TaxID=469 RepID=UPI00124F88A9|nr:MULTISPECIES: hypothetical protein [Acinetobacter]MDN5418871.1 hypothetical protein [Acinetobacter sp.]MCG7221628.1 hypothetical protein [Acinetobacter sp. AG3]MDN5489718.1 hypothetical protein [Acinetobacter sp.]MDN5623952.1 hypothetical protein [Acinetobacter sp.]MDN5647076.1 hypothetical protein [Acinetobacter sp.]